MLGPARHISFAARVRRLGRSGLLIALVAIGTALSACKPPDRQATSTGTLAVAVLLEGEAVVGRVPVSVTVTDAGAPVPGARVEVTGNMTHAGMAPALATASDVGEGTYRAELDLTMAGDWIVSVSVTTPDGERASGELLTTVAPR